MKAQRILGIVWFLVFSYILILWFWQAMEKTVPYSAWFRALTSPLFLFGAVAGLFLFRGAKWARISIGVLASLIADIVIVEFQGSFWNWQDGCLGIFALVSIALLFWPRREPTAVGTTQVSNWQ